MISQSSVLFYLHDTLHIFHVVFASRHKATQLLNGFRLNLTDSFGGNTVFSSQFVQRQTTVVLQPAGLHNMAAALIQLRQRILQTFRLQSIMRLFGKLSAGFAVVVA